MKNTNRGSLIVLLVLIMSAFIIGGVFVNAGNEIYSEELNYNNSVIFSQTENKISVKISLGDLEIQTTEQGDELYLENFGKLLVAGKPDIPSKIFSIAIPPGAKVTDININEGEGILLSDSYEIPPVPLARVIGEEDPIIYEKHKKIYSENYAATYGSNENYPENIVEFVRTSGYRKYNLVDVRITPFSYKSQTGQLTYYPIITIDIDYALIEEKTDIMVDNLHRSELIAEEIIINYEQTKNWYQSGIKSDSGLNDYVIVTLDSLTSSVMPLVTWEESKGRTVEVVTTSWIESNYAGYDLAEKIRNFLRDKLPSEEWGIEDLLLVGDYDDVPMRRCWQDLGYGKPETDYYYAELSLPDNQSWDADGDHRYGENSDPIDFYNEINVGRIPFSNPNIVQHICEKSVLYEQNNDPSFKKNILLLGAFFWDDDPNPRTDNAVLMEYKVNSDMHPWMGDWTKTRMYEEGHSTYPMDYNLDNNNVVSVWSQDSFAFVNWAGHGSPDACWRYHHPGDYFIHGDDCSLLNDDFPSIIFADACSNSDTDHLNIGKSMLQQGGVGFVGATKVALGRPGWNQPSDGSSQSLDYYFTTGVTSGDYTQGQAHQRALREMYTQGLWSYDKYETFEWGALWGNPDLGMAPIDDSNPPETPNIPLGPEEGNVEVEYVFTASTNDPDSDQIYYCFSWGDSLEWYGPYNSGEAIDVSHTWFDVGEYFVKVKARDIYGAESDWSDPLEIIITDPITAEIIELKGGFGAKAVIRNTGEENIANLEWSIYINGSFVIIGKENTGFVNIPIGDEVTIRTGFIFGLGNIYITVDVDEVEDEKSATGFLFGPFVLKVE